jgi:DNA repair exonuclease SbcCD ATPase subunit
LYIKAVNRDGLPYMVISNAIPELEREVNNYFKPDGRVSSVSIETNDKDVTPYIVYSDRRWPIEMASGFEKFISGLAIRVALINSIKSSSAQLF